MPGIAHSRPDRGSGRQKIVLLVLALLALGTVFVLPSFVTEPWMGGGDGGSGPVPPASGVKPSTAAEKTRYRQESQAVLARIIAARDSLREQNVDAWAGIEFGQAMDLVDAGDERYGYGEYADSLASYEQALARLDALVETGAAKLSGALADGQEAVRSLNVIVAADAAALAQTIAPQDPGVADLAARAATLPALKEQLELGDAEKAAGRLQAARAAYTRAGEIDPQHPRPGAALAALDRDIVDARFRGHMSRGYAALEEGDFEAARAAFGDAGDVYPNNEAVALALAQVDNRDTQERVTDRIKRAAAHESREEWAQALAIYESLLAEDPTLAEAKAKIIPVRVRADLDARLEAIIADPLALAAQPAYRAAQAALADARGIAGPGPRLNGQADEIDRLLVQAVTPVNVVFRSDSQTHVVLYRVKDLGQFERTSLVLRPGRYVAAGTRNGFRDVRVEFTITGEPLQEPIVVQCEEAI